MLLNYLQSRIPLFYFTGQLRTVVCVRALAVHEQSAACERQIVVKVSVL